MVCSKKSKNLFLKSIITSFVLILSSFFVNSADAATLYLRPSVGDYKIGDIINVSVLVDTSNVPINSAETNISFPSSLLSVVSLNKSDSIFNFWVQEPTFSNVDGTIFLSGGLPNPGYNGSSGKILNVSFRVKKSGKATVSFSSGSVRANDGLGTDVLKGTAQSNFTLNEEKESVAAPKPEISAETTDSVLSLEVKEIPKSDRSLPKTKFSIKAKTTKKTQDISRIETQIDDALPSTWIDDGSHIFETQPIDPGEHDLVVVAYSNAGNILAKSSLKFSIVPLPTPTILYYKKDLNVSDNINIIGSSLPMGQVKIYLAKEGDSPRIYTIESDQNGGFIFNTDFEISKGAYTAWTQAVDINGAKSLPSEKIRITVSDPVVSGFTTWSTNILSVLIIIASLVFVLMVIIMFSWRKYIVLRKRIHKEMQGVGKDIHKTFDLLRESMVKQIKMIKKAKSERDLTTEEEKILKQLGKNLETAEKALQKEVDSIEKRVE